MATPDKKSFEGFKRYVRLRSEPDARFVEFDFAIGYPDMFVELVLPRQAFADFCRHNRVELMDEAMAAAVDEDMVKWRFGKAGRRMPTDD
ncbi:phenol hydroxylase [Stutzerimonas balearica]|uniref:phenol hydroxylase subunit n=1 Tax=Stutzerimonas balearica TaxID=74829 RepID=UPI0013F3A2A9|nr:phenol hydroxylase subunit [Stutzerimonas balearica]QII99140.1 phenol hydroxylase [Stutzerimonas balearica]